MSRQTSVAVESNEKIVDRPLQIRPSLDDINARVIMNYDYEEYRRGSKHKEENVLLTWPA